MLSQESYDSSVGLFIKINKLKGYVFVYFKNSCKQQ
jgi:hypothetical protein